LQPIIVLFLIVIIVSISGLGIQQVQSGNQFELLVQQYGWAEKDIDPPVSDFSVELMLEKELNDNDTTDPTDDFFETFVRGCIFSSTQDMPAASNLSPGSVTCKLMDAQGNAIAEGLIVFLSYTANEPIEIIAFSTISDDSLNFKNIFDVTAIVQAPI